MKLNSAGIELIKSRESCRLKAYLCPAGKWTVGWGHTGPEVHEGMEVTDEEALSILTADLLAFDAGVQSICPSATPGQHSACVSLAYNIGLAAFKSSSVARLHNQGKFAEAAQAFALWNKASGKVLAGLVSRRAAEAALYLSDTPLENAPNAEGEKPLLESRTINGQAIAGGATVAGTTIKIVNDHTDTISQITDALGPIAGYLPSIGYVIVGLTLIGIGLSIYARYSDRKEGRS